MFSSNDMKMLAFASLLTYNTIGYRTASGQFIICMFNNYLLILVSLFHYKLPLCSLDAKISSQIRF